MAHTAHKTRETASKKSNPSLEEKKEKKVLRDLICDNDHFRSSWTEKQYLVPGEYIPGQRETRERCAITAPASPQQGARQGPAAFMARESTVHTLCTNVGHLPDEKEQTKGYI